MTIEEFEKTSLLVWNVVFIVYVMSNPSRINIIAISHWSGVQMSLRSHRISCQGESAGMSKWKAHILKCKLVVVRRIVHSEVECKAIDHCGSDAGEK
jgi:hypothetical protein